MHPQSSDVIILRHTDYGEADRIVSFFSREHGLQKGFARGARKSRKRFGAALEPFASVRLIWQQRSTSSLLSLQEGDLLALRDGLRKDLKTLALASYACELIEVFFGEGGAHPEVFVMLENLLDQLDQDGARAEYRLLLELRLLRLSGHEPHLLHCSDCGGGLPEETQFHAAHGGSLCPVCAVPGGRRVSRSTLGSLARCRETEVVSFAGFRLGAKTLGEGAPIISDALELQLPRGLKSRAFLDQVGPLPGVEKPADKGL
jgi:DNA repair protein RecO (recombination protein O)